MKILAVCGMGFGSSLILKLNIQAALKELGRTDIEVEHCDLTTARGTRCDAIVVAADLAENVQQIGVPVISLANVMAKSELKTKLAAFLG